MGAISNMNLEINPMNFSENQQGNLILEKLRIQKDERKFCDIVIFVDKVKFYLHRNVLASVSSYFERVMFSRKVNKEMFNVTCENPEIFHYFVSFMYTGSIVIHANNVNDLLKLSHRLEVVKLKMYCAQYLERYLDLTNCLEVRMMADKYSLPELTNQVLIFIKNQINCILNSKEILNLDVLDLESLLDIKELSLSAAQILRTILEWVKVDSSTREQQLKQLLRLVKWTDVDVEIINDTLESENLFSTSELSLYLTLSHLSEQGLSFIKFRGIYESLHQKYGNVAFPEIKKEPGGAITKINLAKRRRKQKRLLRGNPIARLAALRSALLMQQSCRKKRAIKAEENEIKLEMIEDEEGNFSPLKCHLCEHFACDTTSLEQHLSSVHSRDVTYKCGVCGYVCQWNNLYLEHIRGHFPGPPYKCDSCEYSCEKLNEMMTHRSVHVEEKTFKCSQCSFRSRSQSTVVAHSKSHSSNGQEKPGNIAAEARNYVCELCGYNTKFLSHLIAHKRIHSADVYRCTYPQCKFTTGTKTQLGSHARSHQGVRPHCCQICGRGFLEKSHLVRHERIHLEEKPFKCHECDYASSRRDKLKEHQARHHGDHASAKVPYKARPNKKSQESYSPGENSGRAAHVGHSAATTTDMQDVLAQQHIATTVAAATAAVNYAAFSSAESHVHHTATTATTLDFHQQQLLTATGRSKEHRNVQQTTAAAAVTAAMMLDPRFHPGAAAGGGYVGPVGSIVTQPPGQVGQPTHQVPEYPTALMSLF